jgi:hypothetical protein
MHRHLLVLALAALAGGAWADPPTTPGWEFANTAEAVTQLVQKIERELESTSAASELGW